MVSGEDNATVGSADTSDVVTEAAGVARRINLPSEVGTIRVRRNYKNKYPDSLYVTIWILYGAGIET